MTRTTKRAVALLLAVFMLCGILPLGAPVMQAAVSNGSCGANLYWSFDDETGELEIYGSGPMNDQWASYTSVPWFSFRASSGDKAGIKSVTIDQGAASIGKFAFMNLPELETVSIPASVNTIAEGAFTDSPSLTAIDVSSANLYFSSVDGVLFDKGQLTLLLYPAGAADTYTVPEGVVSIASGAFELTQVKNVVLPDSLRMIGQEAFQWCSSLESIIIRENVGSIGLNAFRGCTNLVICCIEDSFAHLYADSNGISFCIDPSHIYPPCPDCGEWSCVDFACHCPECGDWQCIDFACKCPECGESNCKDFACLCPECGMRACICYIFKAPCDGNCTLTQVRQGQCIGIDQRNDIWVPSEITPVGGAKIAHKARINLSQESIQLAGFEPTQFRIKSSAKFKDIKEGLLTYNFSKNIISKAPLLELKNQAGDVLTFAKIEARPKKIGVKPYVNYTIHAGDGSEALVTGWGWTLAEKGTVSPYEEDVDFEIAVAPYGTSEDVYLGTNPNDKPLKKTAIEGWGRYGRVCVPDIPYSAKHVTAKTAYYWKTKADYDDGKYIPGSKPKKVTATTLNKPINYKVRGGLIKDGVLQKLGLFRYKSGTYISGVRYEGGGAMQIVDGTWAWYLNPKGTKAPTKPIQLINIIRERTSRERKDRDRENCGCPHCRCKKSCCRSDGTDVCDECGRENCDGDCGDICDECGTEGCDGGCDSESGGTYEDGYEAGYQGGYNDGYNEGYEVGFDEGYELGYEEAGEVDG